MACICTMMSLFILTTQIGLSVSLMPTSTAVDAAVRHAKSQADQVSEEQVSNISVAEQVSDPNIIIMPLDKQYVAVTKNNKTVMHKTAHFGKIYVGAPHAQEFSVIFDTGSGHLFVPSSKCLANTCKKHRGYVREASNSAVDIDHDGNVAALGRERDRVEIEFGTGYVEGEFVWEVVCLQDHKQNSTESRDCTKVRVITATEMSEEPFQAFAFDGVVGLGLSDLAVHPDFSFFGQMAKLNRLSYARFGVFLSSDDAVPSEIAFGGHDARRVANEPYWVPVLHPEMGYWQVKLDKVTVGGKPFALCDGDCIAIVDTGTSLLSVPKQELNNFHWLLARRVLDPPAELDCRTFAGPEVVFHFEGFNITIGPEDYSRPAALKIQDHKKNETQVICRSSLLPIDMPGEDGLSKTWILGEPVLKKYYTIYDWAARRVGFASAVQPAPNDSARHVVHGSVGVKAVPEPSVVQI